MTDHARKSAGPWRPRPPQHHDTIHQRAGAAAKLIELMHFERVCSLYYYLPDESLANCPRIM